jgi:type VI protein secretion system component VasK
MNYRTEQNVGYVGSLIVTVSAWTINEWAAAIGLLLGILTYISGRLYSARREQREKHLAELAEEREALEREAARVELEIKTLELAGMRRREVVRVGPASSRPGEQDAPPPFGASQ